MKTKLNDGVVRLANGASTDEDRPVMTGVHVTKDHAVVADGYMLVIKTLQLNEMKLDVEADDGITSVIIPAEALKACSGEVIEMETIESMRLTPDGDKLLVPNAQKPEMRTVVRMDCEGFSVEADSIPGNYPDYSALFSASPLVGGIAVNTKTLKKLLKTLPNDATLRLRVSEPDRGIEFQCVDTDGDLPIRGIIMPEQVSWIHTTWRTPEQERDAEE